MWIPTHDQGLINLATRLCLQLERLTFWFMFQDDLLLFVGVFLSAGGAFLANKNLIQPKWGDWKNANLHGIW